MRADTSEPARMLAKTKSQTRLGASPCADQCPGRGERDSFVKALILIILIILLLGTLPSWPYSAGWGYYPAGGLGLILAIVIILLVLGLI